MILKIDGGKVIPRLAKVGAETGRVLFRSSITRQRSER
jgi:hypothetical protein